MSEWEITKTQGKLIEALRRIEKYDECTAQDIVAIHNGISEIERLTNEIQQGQAVIDAAQEAFHYNGFHDGACWCPNCALKLELEKYDAVATRERTDG